LHAFLEARGGLPEAPILNLRGCRWLSLMHVKSTPGLCMCQLADGWQVFLSICDRSHKMSRSGRERCAVSVAAISSMRITPHRSQPAAAMKPICKTAFYCCGVRMEDARSRYSICHDSYAHLFMNGDGMRILHSFNNDWHCRLGIAVRHRIMDDMLQSLLHQEPVLRIVTIGAGFDTRPYRLDGGDWIEVDDPWLLGYKECKLPARSAANPLRRLATDFSLAALRKILPQILPRGPVTVVLEGLLIYLDAGQIKALLAVLQEILPGHRLLCDLVSRTVSECYGKNLAMTLMRLGTPLKPMDRPEAVLLDSGYRVVASRSVLETSVALGICPLPDFFIQTFCAREVRGNRVFLFESGAPPASSS